MATKKITDLTELTSAASGDVLPIVDISEDITKKITTANMPISTATQTALDSKQDTLVSGTNIKTINSTSLLGSGDISIEANPSGGAGLIQFSDGSVFASDSNLFWDNTNKRLGVAESTPTARLHIKGSGSTSATTALLVQNSSGSPLLRARDQGQVQLGSSSNFTVDGSTTYNRYELAVGGLSSIPSAILSATSTTRGFLPPRMTTTQKNAISSPASGLIVYDTTTNKLCCYNGTSWNDLF